MKKLKDLEPGTTFRCVLENTNSGQWYGCKCIYKGTVGSWFWKRYIVENLDYDNQSVDVTGDEDLILVEESLWVMQY